VLIAVVILVVYLCCVTPPKKPVKKEPQVWKPILPVVDVPVTGPQQPAPSKGGEGKKSTASTAKADSERRGTPANLPLSSLRPLVPESRVHSEIIPPVVSVPPDAGGEDQPEDNAPVEVPNDEQPQQVPQRPVDSQHASPSGKEWGESVLLPPPK
jgi:hypothetical protein